MELWLQISRQRVKHIVCSYRLDGAEAESFVPYLDDLLQTYPMPAIELALVEVLIDSWGKPSLPRGTAFLDKARDLLNHWKETRVAVRITPEQFRNITGLDPSPIFGLGEGISEPASNTWLLPLGPTAES
jgi:hypothetical protein